MTFSPVRARASAVSESKTALPTAAPGEAFMPLATSVRGTEESKRGNISWASWSPLTRWIASSSVMTPSSTSWVAIRKAACAVRLPTRVWSIQSLPRSMVNSMSQRSW